MAQISGLKQTENSRHAEAKVDQKEKKKTSKQKGKGWEAYLFLQKMINGRMKMKTRERNLEHRRRNPLKTTRAATEGLKKMKKRQRVCRVQEGMEFFFVLDFKRRGMRKKKKKKKGKSQNCPFYRVTSENSLTVRLELPVINSHDHPLVERLR